jgi:Ca2+-binding EF-hand superfamily protein
MAFLFGVALTLLLMDCASEESTTSAKQATESQKEAINTQPPSMELRQKTFEERTKRTVDGFFNQLDVDKDDKVSHDEFMVPMEDRFKGIDTNHDGFITREEFKISYQKYRETRMEMIRRQPGGEIPPKMPPNN